jgi:hypothetical protein
VWSPSSIPILTNHQASIIMPDKTLHELVSMFLVRQVAPADATQGYYHFFIDTSIRSNIEVMAGGFNGQDALFIALRNFPDAKRVVQLDFNGKPRGLIYCLTEDNCLQIRSSDHGGVLAIYSLEQLMAIAKRTAQVSGNTGNTGN